MYTLQRNNVVKKVADPSKAEKLRARGFVDVDEAAAGSPQATKKISAAVTVDSKAAKEALQQAAGLKAERLRRVPTRRQQTLLQLRSWQIKPPKTALPPRNWQRRLLKIAPPPKSWRRKPPPMRAARAAKKPRARYSPARRREALVDNEQLQRIAAEVEAALVAGGLQEPESHRETIARYTRRGVNQILTRCNRDDIPPRLEILAGEIIEAMLRQDKAVPLPEEKEVSSITRGDTAISYRDKDAALKNVASFLKDYDRQLRRFTKMNIPRCRDE